MRTLFSASSPFQLHSVLQIFLGLAVSIFTLRLGAGLFAFRAANKLGTSTAVLSSVRIASINISISTRAYQFDQIQMQHNFRKTIL